jgi:hypothetical protein
VGQGDPRGWDQGRVAAIWPHAAPRPLAAPYLAVRTRREVWATMIYVRLEPDSTMRARRSKKCRLEAGAFSATYAPGLRAYPGPGRGPRDVGQRSCCKSAPNSD